MNGTVMDEKMKAWKKTIIVKEQRKKEEAEAKLLGAAMQQLLPEIFEEKRAIPNSFLRGGLFGMVSPGRRKFVDNHPIFTMSQYNLNFTGYQLDQNDLEVWDTLIYLAKARNVNSQLRITLYELLQHMKIKDSGTNRKAIISRIERLQLGQVKISTDSIKFFGSLINNGYVDINNDGKLVIEYNKMLTPLFTDNDYTLISTDIRHLLGDNQLARWLYNFYESHKEPIPFALNFIQKLCRSETEAKDFKRKLKHSLELVQKAKLVVNLKSKWNYEITHNNYLIIYPKGKGKKQSQLNLFDNL